MSAEAVLVSSSKEVKRFSKDAESRFDLSTYWGRVRHFADQMDPRMMFVTSSQIEEAKRTLSSWPASGVSDADLWAAKKIIDTNLHPQTGERIPVVFRMASFTPVNLLITHGMIVAGPGWKQLVFQWLNQSYNAGFNFANRNASLPVDWTSVATSYGVATTVAVGASHMFGKVVTGITSRLGGTGPMPFRTRFLINALPWAAVASAGVANVLAMRYKEAIDGITITDEKGNEIGQSREAGKICLSQVSLTRALLPIPILLLPPFILDAVKATSFGKTVYSRPVLKSCVELSIIAACLQVAFPLAVATFPQRGIISASALEDEFNSRINPANGQPFTHYYFNKGV